MGNRHYTTVVLLGDDSARLPVRHVVICSGFTLQYLLFQNGSPRHMQVMGSSSRRVTMHFSDATSTKNTACYRGSLLHVVGGSNATLRRQNHSRPTHCTCSTWGSTNNEWGASEVKRDPMQHQYLLWFVLRMLDVRSVVRSCVSGTCSISRPPTPR